jgi:hypothetical protein
MYIIPHGMGRQRREKPPTLDQLVKLGSVM